VLHVTEMLRKAKVVGKFVEFHGEGAASLTLPDRATIANMAPEYGATMGYFPVDEESCKYLNATGRSEEHIEMFRNYFKAQGLFGIPKRGDCEYSTLLDVNLADVQTSVAGPKRPQDRINLPEVKQKFTELLRKPITENGYNKENDLDHRVSLNMGILRGELPLAGGGAQTTITNAEEENTNPATEMEMVNNRPTPDRVAEAPHHEYPNVQVEIGHGSVLIAAITSCTNTSNPSVMLAAGLLAKKAVEKGLTVPHYVKTSLAPGSRVVTEYLHKTKLQPYLTELGFTLVGYGCTTCIGNSGPLDPNIEEAVTKNDLIGASVLSGNRNFEARVHQSVKANFLMSPPLVVAFAIAGRVDIDLSSEPIGKGKHGKNVFLHDIWPSSREVQETMRDALDPETYRKTYKDFSRKNPLWDQIPATVGDVYKWDPKSTYIQEPPFFDNFSLQTDSVSDIRGARALALFGDSVTTDHISPAGAIKKTSPAGVYLQQNGVSVEDFNTYGARRGNDRVMTRGTFANVRIKNLMVPGVEGGVTKHQPDGEQMSIYDAAMKYQTERVPLVVMAGYEYGTGSSRDWAAKGTRLLGVTAVIAQSFERIHRSNLVGMGVLPCQFQEGTTVQTLKLDGSEIFDLTGIEAGIQPRQNLKLVIHRTTGQSQDIPIILRIDTQTEVDYYKHGGILQYVLRQLLGLAN
jgi:aconitate hydratase A / 2-methylisocitrate dehydratase